jgi:hypothetical protein
MARKKSNDNAGALGVILFAALATLITFASAVYGVVTLVAWNYYTRKSSRIPNALSDGYFIATRKERREITELEQALADERGNLKRLNSEGKELCKRNDGQYDARSSVGKRLNGETAKSSALIEKFSQALIKLNNYSHQRKLQYLSIKVGAAAWKNASIAYVVALICFSVYTPEWVLGLASFLNSSGWPGTVNSVPSLWGILAAAALVSVVIQQVLRIYYKHSLEHKLEQAEKPAKHVAVIFTEMLAIKSGIGLYDATDLDRAEALFKERQAIRATHSSEEELPRLLTLHDPQEVAKPKLVFAAMSTDLGALAISDTNARQLDGTRSDEVKNQTTQRDLIQPSSVKKRPIWKRLLTSIAFGFMGVIAGFLGFGISGQGNFGTALVLLLPLVGLVWGFQFRQFSQKVYPS